MEILRPQTATLARRLVEPRRLIQIVAGPRQVGKSTLVRQVVDQLELPAHVCSADDPQAIGPGWLDQQWDTALTRLDRRRGGLLVIDEVQKLPRWSRWVKARWDADTRARTALRLVVLGSSPLLLAEGLDESLAGRFEVIRMQQWSLSEMTAAFRWDLPTYVFHGGYPGAAPLVRDLPRWRAYVQDALVETSISRDVLQLARVDKPALLRRLYELGVAYSGQELSYTKMLGQLADAGNTTTLAGYAELLGRAGLLTALQKHAGQVVRRRASSPKWLAHDNALVAAPLGVSRVEAQRDAERWARIVESAVGGHLMRGAVDEGFAVAYWRDGDDEVDFVVRRGAKVTAIEVKSGRRRRATSGLEAFRLAHRPARTLLVGSGGLDLEAFLRKPASAWIA